MIVDAHAHIMGAVRGHIAAGATRSLTYGRVQAGGDIMQVLPPTVRDSAFPPEMLLAHMDWAGVDQAVLLQGPFYGENNDYVRDAVRRWPDRFVGAAYGDPRAPRARELFLRAVEGDGFRILKVEMSVATGLVGLYPDLELDDETMGWIWDEAARRHLVVTLDLGAVGSASYQTAALRRVVERHPDLRVVIAHLAQPPIGREDAEILDRLWREQIELGRFPNVWFDLSALPAYGVHQEYPYPDAIRYIRRASDLIGAGKLMWGTDAPGLLCQATYLQLRDLVARHCVWLSDQQRADVLGRTAARVYSLKGRGA